MAGFPKVGDDVGPYRITSSLGRGGMGVVFAAIQTNLNRLVALKVLDPRLANDAAFAARFAREANTLAAMDSPHIVQIYDHGEIDGCLYLAMQYVTGGDLAQRLRDGSLPVDVALDLEWQIVSALADAHSRGVIHRDIKPSNVLLARTGSAPFAYLCDFGIAWSSGTQLTTTGTVAGSLAFMAPERHAGQPATAGSDLYSAGCVLWAMLTGANPYSGTDVQMAMDHVNAPVPRLTTTGPMADSLNRILSRSLAKDPLDRYADATEMLADLDAASAIAAQLPPDSHLQPPSGHGDTTRIRPEVEVTLQRRATATASEPANAPVEVPSEPAAQKRVTGLIATALVGLLAVGGWGAYASLSGSPATPPRASVKSPSPTQTTAATDFVCWDGSDATSLTACGSPTGGAALRYLFPSLEARIGQCKEVSYRKSTVSFDCVEGRTGVIRYRYWESSTEALGHYGQVYPKVPKPLILDGQPIGSLYRRDSLFKGVYRISGLFGDGHFSFSVESPNKTERDRIFDSVVSLRARDQLSGRPAGQEPRVGKLG